MLLELFLGFFIFLFAWDHFYKKRRNEILNKSNITGPKSLPLLGSALEFINIDCESLFDLAKRNRAKYGKIYRVWVLHQLAVMVVDVKYLEAILSSQKLIKKSSLYDFLITWLGTGLLLSTGKKWHTRRKIITPAFHFTILEQFVEIFDQQSHVMVNKLYAKADAKTPIDIFPIVCLTALDIIAETAMGVKVNAQKNPDIDYVKALATVAKIMATRFIKPNERTDWMFRLTSPLKYREMNRCIKIMHDFTNNVIEERREALQNTLKTENRTENNEDVGKKKRMALLDVLLQANVDGRPLSNEDIREEVDTFMFEGHDTTTSGISFCLYLISRHPEVQRKLITEIHEVLGTDKQAPTTYRQLQELKYLECTIKETLRLYPSVPAIGREATEDFVFDDITIPAKTNVSLQLFMALRDPDNFPYPDEFKPERFSNENTAKVNPFAFTPFSAGPRNCIGQKFALLEMKSTISKVLRHFELLPLGPAVRPTINLVIRSVNGVHIGLKPRI